jgi:hypothetical protein
VHIYVARATGAPSKHSQLQPAEEWALATAEEETLILASEALATAEEEALILASEAVPAEEKTLILASEAATAEGQALILASEAVAAEEQTLILASEAFVLFLFLSGRVEELLQTLIVASEELVLFLSLSVEDKEQTLILDAVVLLASCPWVLRPWEVLVLNHSWCQYLVLAHNWCQSSLLEGAGLHHSTSSSHASHSRCQGLVHQLLETEVVP